MKTNMRMGSVIMELTTEALGKEFSALMWRAVKNVCLFSREIVKVKKKQLS